MSNWTHVIGTLYIETYTEKKNIKKYVKNKLKKAPEITGSEKNVDIIVNSLNGYNVYVSCDCIGCEYGKTYNQIDERTSECAAPDYYRCPEGCYQTCVYITLVGDLRDRDLETTKKEVLEFFKYIESLDFTIYYHSVSVYEEYSGKKELIKCGDKEYEIK